MACLIANLPSNEIWVRKEYLTDHQFGHGEFVRGVCPSTTYNSGIVWIMELL